MFTGIIETVGEISASNRIGGDVRIVVKAPHYEGREISLGDSIAINGVCLTVIERSQDRLSFDVSVESLEHTLIGEWRIGTKVNLEMAMLPTTRLGGHFVSGHVDGLAFLVELHEDARSWRMVFDVPQELKKYIAKKGSITINGTSLTVNSVKGSAFEINVIPHTFEVTTLSELQVGDFVHIEVDLIARYLERLMSDEAKPKTESKLSQAFLSDQGFE